MFIVLLVFVPLFSNATALKQAEEDAVKTNSLVGKLLKSEQSLQIEVDAQQSHEDFLQYLTQQEAKAAASEAVVALENAQQFIDNTERREQIFKKGTIVGGISNEVFAEAEEKRREHLGLEPEDQFYFFVSKSMPENLLREYALDAALAGGVLVMRGVEKTETLDSFFKGQFMAALKPENLGAIVQLDPRLFDAFKVTQVPTIVFNNQTLVNLCANALSTPTSCRPLDDDSYYKISGNVTAFYALQEFEKKGADVSRFLSNLKKSEKQAQGINADLYNQALLEIVNENHLISEFNYKEDTHFLELEDYPTPFGIFKAPVGTRKLFK